MRTTLTLEDSVATRLKRLANSRHSSFKEVVNQALKRGIAEMTVPPTPTAYRTSARHLGAFRGIDSSKLGQIDDAAADVSKMAKSHDPR